MNNLRKINWVKWLGLCVMLFAGMLVAQENLEQVESPASEEAPVTASEAPTPDSVSEEPLSGLEEETDAEETEAASSFTIDRYEALMAGIAVFIVSVFVGFEVITKVPQTLHTPLMSGSNAISGITIVGAILVVADCVESNENLALLLAGLAIVLAMVNVVGGFGVTHRMLSMFASKKKKKTA